MWKTFGHDSAKHLLEKQLLGGGFAHAYLFCGPPGIGKKLLAQEFAGKILSTAKPASHSDFISRDLSADGSIESIRELLARLAVKPFIGKFKVALIDDFDQATPAVANALLKTLEEPSPSTIIILVSASRNLLPTVVSRCQIINFNRLSPNTMQEFARHAGLAAPDQLLALSGGAPGRLLVLSGEPELAAELAEQITWLNQLPAQPVAERILAVSRLADMENENLQRLLGFWLQQRRDALRADPRGFLLLNRLLEALSLLATNVNKKLILQRLLLNI